MDQNSATYLLPIKIIQIFQPVNIDKLTFHIDIETGIPVRQLVYGLGFPLYRNEDFTKYPFNIDIFDRIVC